MMKTIRKLLEKTNNIKRSSYVWNAINACLAACECPIILMVMTRTNGIYDAGVFSIAYAVASLMLYLGQYGLRRFQSSDVNEKYTFREYHGIRVISCFTMILASLGYCVYGMLFNDYNFDKFMVVLLVCLIKYVQAYTDVFHGRMQQKGRLDVATKCSAARYILEMASFIVMLLLTKDLLLSTAVCLFVSVVEAILTSVNEGKQYGATLKPSFELIKMKMLAIEGFPLFVSLFLNVYISNAPKYTIDACMTEEMQAYYNLIFMPAFVVGLVAHFIFNPILTTYAELWVVKEKKHLRSLVKLIRKQCYVILGLSVVGVIIAFTIGIPVLSIVFGVDLSAYKIQLVIIMIGGGMLAYATFFSTVLTIIRSQRPLLLCYAIAAIAAKLSSKFFVVTYGITGAVIMYAGIMTLLTILLFAIMLWRIRAERKVLTE